MEQEPVPTQESFEAKLKWAACVPPPPEADWPTMDKVMKDYPTLCSEEQCWILDALLNEAHIKLKEERENCN